MRNFILGGFLSLLLVSIGIFWWQGRAQVENAAPPPPAETATPQPEDLPVADPGSLRGPAPPEATELTREQRRFFRYDRDRDLRVTRSEMLSTRSAAFRKLDKDGNNLLTFEEWAVATADKFDSADGNRDRELSPAEFARTAPKPAARPACRC